MKLRIPLHQLRQRARRTAAALLLGGCAGSAAAADVVRLGGDDAFIPYTNQQSADGGMLAAVVRAAFRAADIDVQLDWQPPARSELDIRSGRLHAGFPVYRSPAREHDFDFSDPVFHTRQTVFARPGSPILLAEPRTLAGKLLCLPAGETPNERLLPAIAKGVLRLTRPASISHCARMVAAGRADFFVADVYQGQTLLRQHDINTLAVGATVEDTPLYVIFRRRDQEARQLRLRFNQGLAAIQRNGVYARILAQYPLMAGERERAAH
ncbi:polar amino acid transport system substrate-binding protein [Andreprevotia lacus DSM 23236]|jgi:polar amino acid transport system substrate-binding protein|uniref:Polar amino acid transport system substrate-binding protein n=1 Tax=Andreprevotia lacus DSM 23236 TaxID=1121001 RepID=A0A1W1XSA3_9NEIS|nr:transporter substrate-binding domain-containing protein [Andreprevotia lacus]SMC26849.1 polar amino acid transport system substrate-binding protein [Andreprevotia lacus DSM 23236]